MADVSPRTINRYFDSKETSSSTLRETSIPLSQPPCASCLAPVAKESFLQRDAATAATEVRNALQESFDTFVRVCCAPHTDTDTGQRVH